MDVRRIPAPTVVGLLLGCDALIAVLRDGHGAGRSGLTPLFVLPVVAAALAAGRPGMVVATAGTATSLLAPIVLSGSPSYPTSGVGSALLLVAVAGVAGLVVAHLATRRRAAEDVLNELQAGDERAGTDAGTGLPNRRSWEDQLTRAIAHARRTNETISVAVCGVDGDEDLLRTVADRWRAEARAADLIARIAGDEFAILLPGADESAAEDVVERLVELLPIGRPISVGVAEWDLRETPAELVSRAEIRMAVHLHDTTTL